MLYDGLIAPFVEFAFMRRALAGCIALSCGAAPVGVFLMLRRMSLAGDAMAHAILPGTAIAFLLFGLSVLPMSAGGLIAGLLVAVSAGLVARGTALREDASLAAFYLISLALGVLIISARGSSVDLMHVLFGTVLALDNEALLVLASVATVTLFILAAILRALIAECVDPTFVRTTTGSGAMAHIAFLVLVVLNLVAGFQALGTLLAVGIMMLPATAAHFWVRRLLPLMALSIAIALMSSICGLLASYHFSVPSGPAIILAAGTIYVGSILLGREGGAVWSLGPRRHRTA